MKREMFIPLDVMECLDRVHGKECFKPHEVADTIEEIWEARGKAKFMSHILQLYREYHGEDYVPHIFRRPRTSPDTGPGTSPGTDS